MSSAEVSYLTAEVYDTNTIKLYWGGGSGTVVLEQSSDKKNYTTIATTSSNPYTVSGLTSNTVYYFRATSTTGTTTVQTNVTLPYTAQLKTFYSGKVSSSEIPLYWSGSFYSVKIQYKRSSDTVYQSITLTGKISYQLTDLDADTTYNIILTPIYVSGEESDTTYSINATTDYVSYVDISLASIGSETATMTWWGYAEYIKFQASTDGDTYTTYSTYNSYSDTSGTATVYGLTPYTTYYFRAVPYNVNFEPADNSTTTSGTTYSGITDFYSSNIKYNQVVLNWAGNYDILKLYKSYDGGSTYNYLTEFDSSTKSYTDTNVSDATTYYYYLITTDSNYGVDVSSSVLECFTDYNNYIDAAVDATTKNSMILRIYSTSVFVSALVQISADSGNTYYDLSYLTQDPADGEYTYYATTYDGTNALSNNTEYTFKITPYGLYGNSGEYITFSDYTLGTISIFDLSSIDTTSLQLTWSGTYSTATIKYGTDSTLSSGTTTITGLTDTSYVMTVSSNISYYYCIIPVNESGVDGSSSSILFNPSIYSIYFSDASGSKTTLRWQGTYSTYTIQTASSSDGTYSDVDGYTNVSSPSFYTTTLSTNQLLYARIIPYSDKSGQTSTEVYNPIVMDFAAPTIDASQIVLYWRGSGTTYNYVSLKSSSGSAIPIDISTHMIGNAITINSSYISDIDPKYTSYKFYLTPFSDGYKTNISFDASGAQYTLTTPAVSYLYISDISYLSTTSSTKMTLNWSGEYTGLYIYSSTDGGATYSKVSTIGDYDSFTYATINSGTTYYKVQPYYGSTSGVMSDAAYIPSITDISISQISYLASGASADSLTLSWTGTYGNVTLQYSTNNSTFYDLSSGFSAASFVVDATVLTGLDLSSNIYYFRATPYCSGVGTGAAKKTTGLTTSAVYNTLVDTIYLDDISSSSATLYLSGTFDKVVIESSTDNSTFSNLSGYLSSSTTSVALSVSSSTSYYYRAVPYYYSKSANGGAGGYSACITSSTVYVPTFSSFYVSTINSNSVEVTWDGTFDEATLEYSDDSGLTWTTIYTITSSSGSLTIDDSYVSGISPQYQTYYFRATPYSTATGVQQTTYNPSISYINIPSISSSSITLEWTGTYDTVDIESSTDGSTWSTLYTSVSSSSITFSTSGYTTIYYRVVPYNSSSPDIAGLTSDSVYIPTTGTISSATTSSEIVLSWTSTSYDLAVIEYSTDNSTFTNLISSITSGTSTYTIDSSIISGLDTTTDTYYFRIVPYTYSYSSGSSDSVITGICKNATYNATITNIYTENSSTYSTSRLLLYYTAVFDTAIVYYGVSAESLTSTASISTDISGTSYLEISSLSSNTTYYFVLLPYNNDSTAAAGAYDISASGSTESIVSAFSLTYDTSNSTYKSVSFTWTDTGYDYVKLYDLSTNTLVYTGSATSYDSSGIENLSSNSTYTYYAAVYDSAGNMETTSNVNAYTYASSTDVSMSYSNVESTNSLSFSWRNNYTTLSIYNYTLYGSSPADSNITTYVGGDGGTTTYNSYVDASDSLSYNTAYTYQITLTNKAGSQTIYYITGYTLASATFNVSLDSSRYSSSAIGVDVSGSYSGFIVYTNDDDTGSYTYGNTYTVASSTSSAALTMNSTNSIVAAANRQYSFKVRPYNMVGTYSSISSTAVATKTLGSITKFYLVSINDVSSINLYWDGSFSKVALETATNKSFTANYTSEQISDVRATTYIADGLSSNTKYYFRITPLNTPVSGVMGDVSGTRVTNDVSGTTKVYISYFNYTNLDDISSDTIVMQWDGTQSTTTVQYSTDGGSTYKTAGTYSDTYQAISGLNANTTYVFRALGYNSAGVASDNYSNTVTAATRGEIRNFYISSIIDNSAVTFYIDGSFNHTIIVYANSSDYTTNVGSTSFTADTSKYYTLNGLNSNTSYYFRAYPVNIPLFNAIDACGNPSVDVSGLTYGSLNTFVIYSTDLSYNGIAVSVDGSYSQLYLEQSSDGGSTYSEVGYYDNTVTKIAVYNLSANTQYYFRGTIQNSDGVSSTSVITNAYTLGQVTSFYEVAVLDSSAIQVYIDGSYSRVVIENTTASDFVSDDITAVSTTLSATTYTITGLSANTKYYFRATPINNPLGTGDISGISVQNDVSGTTLSST